VSDVQQTEVKQANDVSLVVAGSLNGVDGALILHDGEVALAAKIAELDLTGSEDEDHDELVWRDAELRQRRSQSGQGVNMMPAHVDTILPARSFRCVFIIFTCHQAIKMEMTVLKFLAFGDTANMSYSLNKLNIDQQPKFSCTHLRKICLKLKFLTFLASVRSALRASWRRLCALRWPWSTEQSILMLRRGATAVLLVLAALTMLFVLVPVTAAVARGTRVVCWNPLRVMVPQDAIREGYGLEIRHPPPV
jgi:hypothetical protein